MKKLHLLGAVCACLAWMNTSHAVTIDFESATTSSSGGINNGNPYVEDGFSVSTNEQGIFAFEDGWQSNRGSSNGRVTASVFQPIEIGDFVSFDLAQVNGGAFSFLSIDFGELLRAGDFAENAVPNSVLITGTLNGGGTVSTTINIDLISDGIGGVDDFQSFSFDSQWGNLLSVNFNASPQVASIYGTKLNFDNIVVSNVPIPPALWLFGSGLLGLIGVARKKTV
jgi:hypothetical protein